ncbi:MAG: acyltransferase [Prevotella sp.]|jgi:peptidoglycan/LPS O-acetylase OafA/YrhL|nr:acyltransferase [Prevotella sp.]
MEPKKYQYIDSLRGIAVLMVVLVHIRNVLNDTTLFFPADSILHRIIGSGGYGVQLFFIVSAYTLTMSYYNRIDEAARTKKFFIRRFFRIAPMYYLAIIYFTLDKYLQFNLANPDFSAIPLRSLISNVFFTNALIPEHTNNYVPGGWSVSVEFIFYFLMPLICSRIKSVNSAMLLFLATLTFAVIIDPIFRIYTIYPYFQEYNFFVQLPVFPLGVMTYLYLNNKDKTLKPFTLACLMASLLVFCYIALPKHILFSLLFALVLIIQSRYSFKALSNKLLAEVGKVSFSLYLVHFAVIYLFNRFGFYHVVNVTNFGTSLLNFALMYIIVACAAFIISSVTYRFIEVPGQNLGKKLIKELSKHQKLRVN